MELIRCKCPRLDKVHKWELDLVSGVWYHASCGRAEGPPLFFRSYLTDEDFKNRIFSVETYKDECSCCGIKIEQDVKLETDLPMCNSCIQLNPELFE